MATVGSVCLQMAWTQFDKADLQRVASCQSLSETPQWACHPGGLHWHNYPGVLTWSQVTATHLKMVAISILLQHTYAAPMGQPIRVTSNGRGDSSNHRKMDCLWIGMFIPATKTLKPRITSFCEGNQSVAGGFSPQRDRDVEMFPYRNWRTMSSGFHGVNLHPVSIITQSNITHHSRNAMASKQNLEHTKTLHIDGLVQDCSNCSLALSHRHVPLEI